MGASILIQTLSSSAFFTTRPFLATFMVSLVARFGPILFARQAQEQQGTPSLFGLDTLLNIPAPAWLVHDYSLVALGLLTIVEFFASRDEDIGVWLERLNALVKPILAAVVTFGLIDAQSAAILTQLSAWLPLDGPLGAGVATLTTDIGLGQLADGGALGSLGYAVAAAWALLVGGVTWYMASLRNAVMEALTEADDGDSLGLGGFFTWIETGWTVGGLLFVALLPAAAIVIFALTLGGLLLAQRAIERRERRTLIPCEYCGRPLFPSALTCPACGHANPGPRRVGVFGQATRQIATDRITHRFELIARRRCPVCATRLKQRAIQQACPTCATVTFADTAAVNGYLRWLNRKLPLTLLICLPLSFVPILGLIGGAIFYRLTLIASVRAYVSRGVGCATRWGLRLATIAMIALQPVPIIGWFMVPLLCLLNYVIYRQVMRASGADLAVLHAGASPPTAGPTAPLPRD